jgi:hypothetical protein
MKAGGAGRHNPQRYCIVEGDDMLIKSQKDFFSGLMFTVVGGGYFPMLLGIVLAVLGLFVIFYSLVEHTEDGEKVGSFAWKPLAYILGANLVFGVLLGGLPSIGLPPMGLILAIYALVLIASLAGENFRLRDVLLLASILAVGSYLAFIVLLKLQMPVWPTFIAG